MKSIVIFDKPMCCSTGVCGPAVDPVLAQFADDLRWLANQGVTVTRHNPAQDPTAFMRNPVALKVIQDDGEQVLPLVLAGGEECSRQRYPSRGELAAWAGISNPDPSGPAQKGGCCGGNFCC